MTIDDIAKKFNINSSTVSKALNGSTDIAASTRKAICEYAESVGYRSLRSRKIKGNVAVLKERGSSFDALFDKIIEVFCTDAKEENYLVSVQEIDGSFDLNEFVTGRNFAGLFILGTNYSSAIRQTLRTTEIPTVIFGNEFCDNPRVSNVKSDDLLSAGNAIDHLVSLGHSLIAFLGTERDALVGAERFAGYFFGLSKNAIPYRYDLTYFGDSSYRSGKDAAEYFISYNKYFTAIVCASQNSAEGFIDYMTSTGKTVPDDISVIGFKENFSKDGRAMTGIAPDFASIGKQAFLALKATLQGFPAQHVTVPCFFKEPQATCTTKKKRFSADAD